MNQFTVRTLPLVAVIWSLFSMISIAEEWWQFRGPGNGHAASGKLPIQWDGFLYEPIWKSKIPGKGWSSPIILGDRIWLTSAEEVALDVNKVAERLEDLPFGSTDITANASVTLFALELDAKTGRLIQRVDLFKHEDPPPIHRMNSYASPTPVTDGKIVVCHFGALGTASIEAETGKVIWKRELFVDELTGGAASPVMNEDHVFLACDGTDEQYMIALDKHTGDTRWKTNRPDIRVSEDSHRRSFSTPLLIEAGGRHQLISSAAQWLVSYNPKDGREWWRAKVGTGYSIVPTPAFGHDRVYVCTGFMSPELVAVDVGGSGDVTETAVAWRYKSQVPEISSPIVVDEEIYFVSTNGIATCLDIDTGEVAWKQRIGGHFAASPLHADGKIYLTSSGGVTTVIQAGREYKELSTNELFGETFASLAVYQNSFLLRTNPYLFRITSER